LSVMAKRGPEAEGDAAAFNDRVETLRGARLEFEPLEAMTDKARTDMYRHQAEADMMYLREEVFTPEELREARSRSIVGFPVVRGRVKSTGLTTPTLTALQLVASVDPEAAGNIALALLKGEEPDWPDKIKKYEPSASAVAPGAPEQPGKPDGRATGQVGKAKATSRGGNAGKG